MSSTRQQRQVYTAVWMVVALGCMSTAVTAILAARPHVTAEIVTPPAPPPQPIVQWTAAVTETVDRTTSQWTMHCDGDAANDNLALWCVGDPDTAHWSALTLVTQGSGVTVRIGSTLRIDASVDQKELRLSTNGLVSTFPLTTLGTRTVPTNKIPTGPGMAMVGTSRIAFDGNFPQNRRGTHTMSFRIEHAPNSIDIRYDIGTLDSYGRRVITAKRSGVISLRPAQ